MYIDCITNNGKPYLRVAESYSVVVDGVRKNRKRTIRSIGPLSRFDDGRPDYLARLKQSFKQGEPLIRELQDLVDTAAPQSRITIAFDRDDDLHCLAEPKNVGYFLLDALYDMLGIYDVLNKYKSMTKTEYDLNGLTRLLVFGRVLHPDSKAETFREKEQYLFGVADAEHLGQVYRTLDVLDETAQAVQTRINHKIKQRIGRDAEICYYDVTNYYFETDQNDPDLVDEHGNLLHEGMRKRGPSKEKRSEPIVQMGLFLDNQGIPIAYRLFPGNHIDQTTLRPALKQDLGRLGFGRVIVVADGGLNSDKNIAHLLSQGNGYILAKSTKKSTKAVREWIKEDSGYDWNPAKTFKVKSMIRERTVKDEAGKAHTITEKLICYWSRKHYERELKENAQFLDYLESVIRHPDKLKDKPRKIEKFLKKVEVDPQTGEVLDTATCLAVDLKKVQEYKEMMGYYTLLTSEVDKTDRSIIEKYHGLTRIEDAFRITKSELEGRPVYVRVEEHINAHFLICFIALTMIRLIQHRILLYQGKAVLTEDGWEAGLSARRIRAALLAYQADALPGGYYRVTRPTEDLELILKAFGLEETLRLPTIHELKQHKYQFDRMISM